MLDTIKKLFSSKSNSSHQADNAPPKKPETKPEAQPEAAAAGNSPHFSSGQIDGTSAEMPEPSPAELKLEALFAQAAHESSKRELFLTSLFKSELFVLGQIESPSQNGATNIQLATQMLGEEPVALVFTSLSAMANAGHKGQVSYVRMNCIDFLRMIRGQLGFALNPGNRVSKYFSRNEVEQLTGAPAGGAREIPMPERDSVSIGQPSTYPDGLREALSNAVHEIEVISSIHTGLMVADEGQPPVLIAVISTTREHDRNEFLNLVNLLGGRLSTLGPIPLNFAPMTSDFDELIQKRALIDTRETLL